MLVLRSVTEDGLAGHCGNEGMFIDGAVSVVTCLRKTLKLDPTSARPTVRSRRAPALAVDGGLTLRNAVGWFWTSVREIS